MNLRTPTLLLVAGWAFAADAAPAAPAVAEPVPAQVAPAAAAAPAIPAIRTSAAEPVPPPVPAPRVGSRVARVAGAPPLWDVRATLAGGWDSNAILDNKPDLTNGGTAVYSGDLGLGWRPIADQTDYLKATLTAGYDRRPNIEDLNTTRLGLGVVGAHQAGSLTWGGSLNAGRYWVENDGAAAELRGGGTVARLRADSADLFSIEAGLLLYEDVDDRPDNVDAITDYGSGQDRSGVLAAAGWRHWWLMGEGSRVESLIRAGRFQARIGYESYDLVQPAVAWRKRAGVWESTVRAGLELRAYVVERPDESDSEDSATASVAGAVDRRLGDGWSAGLFAGYAIRDSSIDDHDYQRWQAGLRLSWALATEE